MGTSLSQTRGDTRSYSFTRIDAEGEPIEAVPDSVYFTVKKNYNTAQFVLQKTLDDMTIDEDFTYHFIIEPEDTSCLPYGKYVYDIQITQDGVVTTVAKGSFILTEEATWVVNEGGAHGH